MTEKGTVEDYRLISTKELLKKKVLGIPAIASGYLEWKAGDRTSTIGIEINTLNSSDIRFGYCVTDQSTGESRNFDYRVQLIKTPCHYGGIRWWFKCPIEKNGVYCGRRVGVLYFRWNYFGCRECMDLIYKSSKDSHKLDSLFRKIGIDPKTGNRIKKRGNK